MPDKGDAYAASPLNVWDRATGAVRQVSYGDHLVRPVWSPDGTSILFVRVAPAPAYPGARWTLLQVTPSTGRTRVLDRRNALNLAPVGWRRGKPLYVVATATDSSVFTIARGRREFISILMPQVITNPNLSPSGRYIGFAAPSDCFFCTYDNFDIAALHTTVGPSGGQNERDMAWSRAGTLVAVPLKDRIGIVRPPEMSAVTSYPAPAGLPRVWIHPMTFIEHGTTLTLIDTVTNEHYSTSR
jgi:hypothetical protein